MFQWLRSIRWKVRGGGWRWELFQWGTCHVFITWSVRYCNVTPSWVTGLSIQDSEEIFQKKKRSGRKKDRYWEGNEEVYGIRRSGRERKSNAKYYGMDDSSGQDASGDDSEMFFKQKPKRKNNRGYKYVFILIYHKFRAFWQWNYGHVIWTWKLSKLVISNFSNFGLLLKQWDNYSYLIGSSRILLILKGKIFDPIIIHGRMCRIHYIVHFFLHVKTSYLF